MMGINSDNHKWEKDACQNDKEERDAVNTEVPRNTPSTNPLMLGHKLKTSILSLEFGQHPQRHSTGTDADDESSELHILRTTIGQQRHDDSAQEWNEN